MEYTKENEQEIKKEMIDRYNSLKVHFFGEKTIYVYTDIFSRKFIEIYLTIDAIYNINFPAFVHFLTGKTIVELENMIDEKNKTIERERIERDKIEATRNEQRKEAMENTRNNIRSKYHELNFCKCTEQGEYIIFLNVDKFKKIVVRKCFGKLSYKKSIEYSDLSECKKAICTEKMLSVNQEALYIKLN